MLFYLLLFENGYIILLDPVLILKEKNSILDRDLAFRANALTN